MKLTQDTWTTALGFLAGAINYLVNIGVQLPTNKQEWGSLVLSAILAGLGYKAAAVTKKL